MAINLIRKNEREQTPVEIAAAIPASDTQAGVISYYNYTSIDLAVAPSSGFDTGTLAIERIGKTINYTIKNVTWTGSKSIISTGTGTFPDWARPDQNFRPVVAQLTGVLVRVDINTGGSLDLRFVQQDLSTTSSQTSIALSFCATYVLD